MAQNDGGAGAAVAGAAVSALGSYAGEVARNKRQWRYQQKAMDKQQQMNIEAWNMQNAYNTPAMEMQRLEEAGLNPRLVYGSSGGGAPAGPMSVPEVPVRQATAPRFDGENFFKYFQVRQMDAQYKATMQNIDNMRKNAALTELKTGLENLKLFRENLRAKNYPALISAEKDQQQFLALRSQELFQNERTKGDLMDQLKEVRKKQMTGMDLDNAFKQHRNDLAKLGIYQSDHPAFRVLIRAADRMGIDLGELLAEGAGKLKYLLDLGK